VSGSVTWVGRDEAHRFSKQAASGIRLVAGLGVEGDAHMGATVQHRSRVAKDPTQANLRQVHLMHEELFKELARAGFNLLPGELGENVTTRGIDLLSLPLGTLLHFGPDAVVEVTGLRNPCAQIDAFLPGLLRVVCYRSDRGELVRKTGIMGVVRVTGEVKPGDNIGVILPPEPHSRLERV
jgi:MOSC domain-containing protein YiiM